MKRQITFLMMMLFGISVFAQEVLVEWNFPDESADAIADGGIQQNLDKEISTMGGTSALDYKNGATTKAAQASGWDNGAGVKYWQIVFSTEIYGDVRLSSKITSGGNDPGPRDFRVDYKIGEDGEWAEVPNSTFITANDWTTGVLENLPLPEVCNNQPLVYLRWIMTSDTSSAGVLVEPNGKLKIDDVVVTGTDTSGLGDETTMSVAAYPNPFTESVTLQNFEGTMICRIFDLTGRIVFNGEVNAATRISLQRLQSGIYTLQLFDNEGKPTISQKLMKK